MPLLTRGRHNAAAHSWERRNILASSKALVYLFAIATCLGVSSPVASQELLELARAQAIRRPGRPVEIPAAPAHNPPKTLDQLTNEAVAVVQVTLSRINSYVGSRGDRVLTDYLITTPMVIAGELPAPTQRVPRPGTSPILTVYGGEVVLEGVTVRCTDNNRDAIKDGAQYLIFLRPSRAPSTAGASRYEVYHGVIFEVSGDQVRGLLNNADHVFVDLLKDRATPKDLVARIQKAAQAR